eukprot:356623-Chlamydomonas_euryale.AAC.3
MDKRRTLSVGEQASGGAGKQGGVPESSLWQCTFSLAPSPHTYTHPTLSGYSNTATAPCVGKRALCSSGFVRHLMHARASQDGNFFCPGSTL